MKKPSLIVEDELFEEAASAYSKYMELVESCDWDEDRAGELFEEAFGVFVDLFEYSKHDQNLIKDNHDFVKLYRANMKSKITEKQFKIVYNLVHHKIKEELQRLSECASNN